MHLCDTTVSDQVILFSKRKEPLLFVKWTFLGLTVKPALDQNDCSNRPRRPSQSPNENNAKVSDLYHSPGR